MVYPLSDLTTRRVVATYADEVTGRPAKGKVTFTPQAFVKSADGDTLLVPTPFTVPLDDQGRVQIDLPIGNDADYTPAFVYQVDEVFHGRITRGSYYVSVPAGMGDWDLIAASPVTLPDPVQEYVLVAGGTISGNLAIAGTLGVTGTTTVQDLVVTGTATGITTLNTSLNANITGDFAVGGTSSLHGTSVTGNFTTTGLFTPAVHNDRSPQLFLGSSNNTDNPSGFIQNNIVFSLGGTYARPGITFKDTAAKTQGWFGWHDLIPAGNSHHGLEFKGSSLPGTAWDTTLVTFMRIKTDVDQTIFSHYSTSRLELASGIYNPNAIVSFDISIPGPTADTSKPFSVAANNTGSGFKLARISAKITSDTNPVAIVDIGAGITNPTGNVNVNNLAGGRVQLFRDALVSLTEAKFNIYLPGTSTQKFSVNAITGDTFTLGSLKALGQDGTTLKKAVLEDNPIVVAAGRPRPALRGTPCGVGGYVTGNGSSRTIATNPTVWRIPFKVAFSGTNLRLVFQHVSSNTTSSAYADVDPADPLTITSAGLEMPGGAIYPITVRGNKSFTIDAGFIESDPISVNVAAGDIVYARTCLPVAATYYLSRYAYFPNAAGGAGGSKQSSDAADYAYSGAINDFTANGTASPIYGPSLLTVEPTSGTKDVWFIAGDSIANSVGDAGGGFAAISVAGGASPNNGGFLNRAFYGKTGVINAALAGSDASEWVLDSSTFRRWAMLSNANKMVCELGRNDLFHSRTLAQIQGNLITIWLKAFNFGIPCYQTTVTPNSTSTDYWATTTNQTPGGQNSVRVQLNQWLRQGAPMTTGYAATTNGAGGAIYAGNILHPLTSYIDVCSVLESSTDSGFWPILANSRSVTDAAVASAVAGYAQTTLTSATANFTSADVGRAIFVTGAGQAGGLLTSVIRSVSNSTTVYVSIDTGVTTTVVSGANATIGDSFTRDGTHPDPYGAGLAAAYIRTQLGL